MIKLVLLGMGSYWVGVHGGAKLAATVKATDPTTVKAMQIGTGIATIFVASAVLR